MKIGYHASHEQFTPTELLEYTRAAEKAGFNAAMCSDHFHPWSRQHGQSAFAWSWLGAAMQATDLPFGIVCAPGQRYHPAVIAQAVATLLQMYPGRFWIAVGSGQLLNGGITGGEWPYSLLKSHVETALRSPEAFEAAAAFVKPEDMRDFVWVSSRLEDHRRWLQEDLDIGFEELYLHNVNRRQRQFIDDFGAGLLPELLGGGHRQ